MAKTLQPEVAAKYRLLTIRPGKHNFAVFGTIDLTELKLARADELFKKDFPFFQLRNSTERMGIAGAKAAEAGKALAKVLNQDGLKTTPDNPPVVPVGDLEKMRCDKSLVNKLLVLDWKDIDFHHKLIFFIDEAYFLGKKSLMIKNGDLHKEMIGFHAKMKALDPDEKFNSEREVCMTKLTSLDERKKANWLLVDTWEDPHPIEETDPLVIARKALDRDKLIKAHNNYIWRYEKIVDSMPVETEKERGIKQKRVDEIARRRKELIDFGFPYNRKSR